jgi:hypothetical protein
LLLTEGSHGVDVLTPEIASGGRRVPHWRLLERSMLNNLNCSGNVRTDWSSYPVTTKEKLTWCTKSIRNGSLPAIQGERESTRESTRRKAERRWFMVFVCSWAARVRTRTDTFLFPQQIITRFIIRTTRGQTLGKLTYSSLLLPSANSSFFELPF